jgi:transcriptional regulator with XRE-family HTH domain
VVSSAESRVAAGKQGLAKMASGEHVTFGALLRRHRLAASLSQEALAERAGLSAAAVASLERGRRTSPRPDTLGMLADALGLAGADRAQFISAATGAYLPQPEQQAAPVAALARSVPQALPEPPGALIGREREEAAVTHLLQRPGGPGRSRLLTLIGPGGVGKTRLALAVSSGLQESCADGAIFVDLAPHNDPALVMPTIAAALGLCEAGPLTALEVIRAALRERELLLVLDNVEQAIGSAAAIADLVASCPRISILVTSRLALRVRAEQQFRVMPLPVPAAGRQASLDALGGYAAIRLFVLRAQAVLPSFALTDENAAAITTICRRLDLAGLAWVALAQGEAMCAARLLGAASSLRDLGGVPLMPSERDTIGADRRAVRAALRTETREGDIVFRVQWDAGRTAAPDVVIAEALRAARHPSHAEAASVT